MNYFSKNLRFLRTKKALGIHQFESLGIKKGTMSNYELAKTEPKFETLQRLSKFFGISIDDFINQDLEQLEKNVQVNVQVDVQALEKNASENDKILCKGNAHLAEKESDLSPKNIYPESNLNRPSVDIVSIPIVEISVAAGDGYYNGDTLDVIDSIQLPQSMVKRGSQYFCVRVKGESMAPTLLDSSFLVIRLLDRSEWEYMPEEQVYVVTDRDGKAYVKRVKNRLDKGFIVCMSDNPDKAYYPNFNLQTDEIHTIWHAEWYISAKMPNIHQTYYTKVSQLEDDMAEMKNDITMLKRLLKH